MKESRGRSAIATESVEAWGIEGEREDCGKKREKSGNHL